MQPTPLEYHYLGLENFEEDSSVEVEDLLVFACGKCKKVLFGLQDVAHGQVFIGQNRIIEREKGVNICVQGWFRG